MSYEPGTVVTVRRVEWAVSEGTWNKMLSWVDYGNGWYHVEFEFPSTSRHGRSFLRKRTLYYGRNYSEAERAYCALERRYARPIALEALGLST